MDALILAAGLGTRLRPLTDKTPKALVEVRGGTLLEHVAARLVAAGADRLIVNVHHHAEAMQAFLAATDLGAQVVVSLETEQPLETGGAIRHAAGLLKRDEPFFLHNVDVLTDLPLAAMYAFHQERDPLATVAVKQRKTTRHLLFDTKGLLGRDDETRGLDLRVREAKGDVTQLGFSGVHVIAPRFLDLLTEDGAFSILVPYLRLTAAGEVVLPFAMDEHAWIDVGRPESLERARRELR